MAATTGHSTMLNPGKHREKLTQLSERLSDVKHANHDHMDLLKWLKAYRFSVEKAEEAYRKSMKWRAEFGADDLLTSFTVPEVVHKYYPGGTLGQDKQGRPVCYELIGACDIKGMMRSVRRPDIIKALIYKVEQAQERLRQVQQYQCTQIFDVQGFGAKHMWIPAAYLYIDFIRLLQDNYPEMLHKVYVINAPRVFSAAFGFIKQFLDEVTAEKFVFLGSDWQRELLEGIEASQLPVCYGGTLTDEDGDPTCSSQVKHGGDVPTSYYLTAEKCFPEEGTQTTHVGRGSSLQLQYDITTNNALRWVFATEGNPIKFGVFRKSADDVTEEVIPMTSVDSHVIPEEGVVICTKPGTYTIVFDNRNSWFTRRKLIYYITSVDVETNKETKEGATLTEKNIASKMVYTEEEKDAEICPECGLHKNTFSCKVFLEENSEFTKL